MKYLITIFAIVIASFILSEHFTNNKIEEEFKYNKKDYFTFTFIFAISVWGLFFISLFTKFKLMLNISYLLLIIIFIKELMVSVDKINYYNKKFKIILRLDDYNRNVQSIKVCMVKDSIKNLFYVLATPCICLKIILNFILDKLFKGG